MDEMLHRSFDYSAFSLHHLGGFILSQERLNYNNAFMPFQPGVELRKMENIVGCLKGLWSLCGSNTLGYILS